MLTQLKSMFVVSAVLVAGVASANPRALPFTYPSESLPQGQIEFEQFVDMTPVPALTLEGDRRLQPLATMTTELEYGITSALELGLYLQLSSDPSLGAGFSPFLFDGVKQRLRYRLADPGEWPVDVAFYAEIAELHDELELEGKVILQRRFGQFRVASNLVIEREFYYAGEQEWVFAPTLGLTFEPNPSLSVGLESFLNAEFGAEEELAAESFNASPQVYVGPTGMYQWKRLWLSAGAYVRATEFDRLAQDGDRFGRFWVRGIVGLEI